MCVPDRRVPRMALFLLTFVVGLAGPASSRGEQAAEGVHLQVESSRRVGNDRMQAVLAVEAQDTDAAELADRVNRAMAWALETARRVEEVRVESGSYQTRPVWDKQKIRSWHASQQLLLEAAEPERLSILVGELQSRLQLKDVSFTVSPEQRRQVENELIVEALDAFKVRAEIVRNNLSAESFRIAELHIEPGGAPTPVRFVERAALHAAGDAVAAPAFEAGTSRVTVRVRGRIVLGE